MKLDLKKFKKIEFDDKQTLLEHDDGHQLKIAHKGLSKEYRQELDKMPVHKARGGFAKWSQKYDPNVKQKAAKMAEAAKPANRALSSLDRALKSMQPKQASSAWTEPQDQNSAIPEQEQDAAVKALTVKSLNKQAPPFGPMGPEKPAYPPCINPSCKSFGKSHPNCRCYGGVSREKNMLADGGEVGSYCSQDRAHKEDCEYFAFGTSEPVGEAPPMEEAPQEAQVPDLQGSPVVKQMIQDPSAIGGSEVPAGSAADSLPPQEQQVPMEQAPVTPVEKYHAAKNSMAKEYVDEMSMFKNDMDQGHIKPETYHDLFAKKSTLGKVGTIFGMLMGGIGSGLTGQPNALMEMMKSEIQNDLAAQQQSVGNKQNFVKIAQQGLLNKAQISNLSTQAGLHQFALANLHANQAALQHLQDTLKKFPEGTPEHAKAQQALAMVSQYLNMDNSRIIDMATSKGALMNTLQGGSGQPNTMAMKSGLMGPEMQKAGEDIEQKTVPGIPGRASYPLGSGEKEELHGGIIFDKAINDLIDWSKKHPNGAIPGSPEDQRGRAIAGIVQGKFREATKGGVYKSGEQEFINKLIPEDPTKAFNAYRVLPKLQAVRQEMYHQLDQKAKNYGFQGYPTRGKDGKLYVRSPDGKHMVPVR